MISPQIALSKPTREGDRGGVETRLSSSPLRNAECDAVRRTIRAHPGPFLSLMGLGARTVSHFFAPAAGAAALFWPFMLVIFVPFVLELDVAKGSWLAVAYRVLRTLSRNSRRKKADDRGQVPLRRPSAKPKLHS